MPHIPGKRYVVVSCHVERPLDDACWNAFSALQARRPGDLTIAALMRPPDFRAGEDEELWLERAQAAAARGPLGHHTHFVGVDHARPDACGAAHAERVRSEAAWLRERGLAPQIFCGGGWFIDEDVARAVADLGYADCSATAFRPSYLPEGEPRLAADGPAWLALTGGGRVLELPTTHSLGMAARAAAGKAGEQTHMHVYFHDTDLRARSRALVLSAALAVLGRRRAPIDLAQLAEEAALTAPEASFSSAASAP
jgi:hypothetical protein